jgi:hypothetical protein
MSINALGPHLLLRLPCRISRELLDVHGRESPDLVAQAAYQPLHIASIRVQ